METLGKAVLELVADIKPLAAGLEEGKAMSEEMAKTTATGFKSGITKAAIPAAAALGAVVVGLHKSVDAAIENQVAEQKLAAAFKASGQNIDDYKGRIDDAEASSAALGFKSEDVKASLAQLVVATKSGSQAIQLLATAQDVARYKGISLTDASKLLTTTMAGSARAAHALGIVVPPVTAATDALKSKTEYATLAQYEHAKATAYLSDKQATAREMMDLLNKKLGGQADAFSKTAQGAKEKMGAEFQLLEINIGNVLIPVLTHLSQTLAGVSEWLTKHAAVAKILITVIGALSAVILAWTAYTKLAAIAQDIFNAAVVEGELTMGAWLAVIALVIIAFVELWKHSQTFRDIVKAALADVETAFGDLVAAGQAVVSFFTTTLPNAATGVGTAITGAFDSVKTWFTKNWPEIATLISGPFAPLVALATNGFGIRTKLVDAFKSIVTWMKGAWHNLKQDVAAPFLAIAHLAAGAFGLKDAVLGGLKAIMHWLTTSWHNAGNLIALPFHAAYGLAKSPLNKLIDAINWIIGGLDKIHFSIPSWVPGIGGDGFGINIPKIPHLAEGGIVTSPTVALIGEAGPEAVVPLSKGAGRSINVTVNGVVGNEREVAVKIGRELQRLKNRGLDFGLA